MNQPTPFYEKVQSLYHIARKAAYVGLAALALYAMTSSDTYAKGIKSTKSDANSQAQKEAPNAIEKLIVKFVGGTGRGLIGSYDTIEKKLKGTSQWKKGKKSWNKYFTEEGRTLNEIKLAQKDLKVEKKQTDRVVKLLQQHGYQIKGYSQPHQPTHTGNTHQTTHPQQGNVWNEFMNP